MLTLRILDEEFDETIENISLEVAFTTIADYCWFKQHVQYEMDRMRSQHPVCKSETKLNVIW